MRTWRLLDSGPASGADNMGVDEALARSVAAGGSPVLRFYRWDPPAVSVGYSQDMGRELDLARCHQLGIHVVRRPTGGRAVLHWEELTYCVVCAADDPALGGAVEAANKRIGECLVAGLRRVGIPAELERAGMPGQKPRGAAATAPCFSSAARWEVTCGGRKLVGSAQRRFSGIILQHGSLLTGPAHRNILELVPALSTQQRQRWRELLEKRSTQLDECPHGDQAWPDLVAALAQGFSAGLPAVLKPSALRADEIRAAAHLAATKYRDADRRRNCPDSRSSAAPARLRPASTVC